MAANAALDSLQRFIDHKRGRSLTGKLLGLGLPERDLLLAPLVEEFEASLERAKEEASRTGKPVSVDGSAVSLTDGGDTWWVHPDGTMTREYSTFPGFGEFLAQLGHPPALDPSRPVDHETLLQAGYNAFWSPSATNWQPVRVVELTGESRERFLDLVGWRFDRPVAVPLLLLLRRDHYESLLGDVLEPYGLAVTAREESIDVGIFAQALAMTALSRSLSFKEHVFSPEQLPEATRLIRSELERRQKALGSSELERLEADTIALLLDYLAKGKYLPDSMMLIAHPAGEPAKPFPAFDDVVDQHSTQRVASPSHEFSHEETLELWRRVIDSLAPQERPMVDFVFFHWSQKTPPEIGRAMFEALYGLGADPEAKTGGEGGLLTAITIRNYLGTIAKRDPAYVTQIAGEDWESKTESDLQKATRQVGVRSEDLGRYLLERILRDGKYQVVSGTVQDTTGKPLSIPVMVRIAKALASTFGNFFLKFQNTHPQNAVLLADTNQGDVHRVYRVVGKAAVGLTYQSRAMGASSIIKTGPIDLARDPIAEILVGNPDGNPEVDRLHQGLADKTVLPAMTFQVGYPLAGSDTVDAGTPNEHTGLEERKRDKRPPRDDFRVHYLPALD